MAASSKQGRDRPLDFRGFLNDLQGWDGDRRPGKSEAKAKTHGVSEASAKNLGGRYNYMNYSGILNDEPMPDAASEKEQGNEYFKQKKFTEAIECYSRSIALSPTAVSFANRAMAYIKLRRFEEAENDCSEALNLDDRYVKAYSRRATARKELGKLKEAMEDAEFAVSLEPNTPELRKQYSDTKVLYMEKMTKKDSGPAKLSVSEFERAGNRKDSTTHTSSNHQKDTGRTTKATVEVREDTRDGPKGGAGLLFKDNSMQESRGASLKPGPAAPMQDLASRAASRYMANSVKNINTPKTAYEFEVSWRALSDDRAQQAQLLKSIAPASLPQIFKNALSAAFLIDIVKCTATFFWDDTELAVSILDNLAKVPRFDMIIMCLSPMHRSELRRIWEEVFFTGGIAADQIDVLRRLQPKYLQGEWQHNMLPSS